MAALSVTAALIATLSAGPTHIPHGLELAPPEFWATLFAPFEQRFIEQIVLSGKCHGFTRDLRKKFSHEIVEDQGLDEVTIDQAWNALEPCWLAYLPRG